MRSSCIVGIGETGYWRRGGSGKSEVRLALEAILAAADDAGVSASEIDGIVSFAHDENFASGIVDALSLKHFSYCAQPFDPSGGGTTLAIDLADSAIASGLARCVVVFRSMRQSADARYGQPGGYMHGENQIGKRLPYRPAYAVALQGPFSAPFGASVPVQHWALHATRHMHEYGTTSEQFGAVAVAFRNHAQRNPRALMYGRPITLEDHQCSRLISSPLRLLDCCLETDGAAAMILVPKERGRDLRSVPVGILASVYGTGMKMTTLHGWENYPSANFRELAPRLWNMAGLGPKEIDVAQIYDHFSSHVIMALEDMGFCKPGEGGSFVQSGEIEWPKGSIPTNTSGGQLSEGYLTGFSLLVEGVRQIRGTSTAQVRDASRCLVTSGGTSCPTGALILSAL